MWLLEATDYKSNLETWWEECSLANLFKADYSSFFASISSCSFMSCTNFSKISGFYWINFKNYSVFLALEVPETWEGSLIYNCTDCLQLIFESLPVFSLFFTLNSTSTMSAFLLAVLENFAYFIPVWLSSSALWLAWDCFKSAVLPNLFN